MCENDPRLSVFELASEDELELYKLLTAKFKNKEAIEFIEYFVQTERRATTESWEEYKEAFKKLIDESRTWKEFRKEYKKVDRIIITDGTKW